MDGPQLELTIGNAGNSLDGQILSTVGRPDAGGGDADSVSDTTVLMNEELGEHAKKVWKKLKLMHN